MEDAEINLRECQNRSPTSVSQLRLKIFDKKSSSETDLMATRSFSSSKILSALPPSNGTSSCFKKNRKAFTTRALGRSR